MAKRSVKMTIASAPVAAEVEQPVVLTEEELSALEEERHQAREKRLAPYRAFHQQQNEQDELLAELLFRELTRE